MSRVVEAVYEDGALKPLERLDLKEGERVKVIIIRSSRGLCEAVRRISMEYHNVKEDPLKVLLEGRR